MNGLSDISNNASIIGCDTDEYNKALSMFIVYKIMQYIYWERRIFISTRNVSNSELLQE